MQNLLKHWRRVGFILLPLCIALLHSCSVVPIEFIAHLDNILQDVRLRTQMPNTMDERIVIVDIDEKSLSELGHWPWGRNKLAALTDELLERQKVALIGFDVFFPEADESSGLKQLQRLAQGELHDQTLFREKVAQLQSELDYDALFAQAIRKGPVVLGYFFTQEKKNGDAGVLPPPAVDSVQLQGRTPSLFQWESYVSNIEVLGRAARTAGHTNPLVDHDGIVRSVALLMDYQGKYYESLSLAMFRTMLDSPVLQPEFARGPGTGNRADENLVKLVLNQNGRTGFIVVDKRASALVPFRGGGGVHGGSFQYISASDIVSRRLAPQSLKDKIVLVGTSAQGLLDLRATPVGEAYPGVEIHANMLSGLLEDRMVVRPEFERGMDVAQLLLAGLVLSLALPLLSAVRAMLLSALVLFALVGVNFWVYSAAGYVLPLAAALIMTVMAFGLNMSYGYFVESRSKRELANLFGTYVPPELVDEMVKDPDAYSMRAQNRELTVMFCDMRGFTQFSESMEPTELQTLLNVIFSRLTQRIRDHRGTIDKYMGDCVMGFWGAPVETPDHAALAVTAALEMVETARAIGQEQQAKGVPAIGIGIGLNSGTMCVGDMGSDIRRSYTVIGDAVNLGSRLEGLSRIYEVDIVVSEATRKLAPDFVWQELDRVRVKGKQQAVSIFTPLCAKGQQSDGLADELKTWNSALRSYRQQDWDACDVHLLNLLRMRPSSGLYALYVTRVASRRRSPADPHWDGATSFDSK